MSIANSEIIASIGFFFSYRGCNDLFWPLPPDDYYANFVVLRFVVAFLITRPEYAERATPATAAPPAPVTVRVRMFRQTLAVVGGVVCLC